MPTCVYRQSSVIVHRQVVGVDAWQKDPDHVEFVPQQSIDKIGDLSIDNREFCLHVCTKSNTHCSAFTGPNKVFATCSLTLYVCLYVWFTNVDKALCG